MSKKQNILVVGTGLSGSTIARKLAENGFNVTIIDKKNHLGGMCYDEIVHNVRKNLYGAHIFYTDNEKIFEWISRFTDWIEYRHKGKAYYNGQFLTFPPNDETRQILGDKLIDILYKPYTKKMWQTEVNNSVFARVSGNNSEYYFKNKYQVLPKNGYAELIKNMLDHKNIKIELNVSFNKNMENKFDYIFSSMSIDSYYDYCFGRLNYRSIKFHDVFHNHFKMPVPVVNFTDDGTFTRIVKWELFPTFGKSELHTLEEPCDYMQNNEERYYPINDKEGKNISLYKRYKDIKNNKVKFIGRCGLYAYIDMDMAISSSTRIVKDFLI